MMRWRRLAMAALLLASTGQGRAALTDGKYLCITAHAAGVHRGSLHEQPYAGQETYGEDHKKFLLTVGPNRLDPVELKLCREAEEYWQDVAQEKGRYPENPIFRTTDGGDVFAKANVATDCLAQRMATLRFYDSTRSWEYYSSDMIPQQYVGVPPGVPSRMWWNRLAA